MIQNAIDHDLIRQRAYQLWLQRGAPEGSPDHDWLAAERELAREATPAESARHLQAVPQPAAAVSTRKPAAVPRPSRARSIVTRSATAPAAVPAAPATRAKASGGERRARANGRRK